MTVCRDDKLSVTQCGDRYRVTRPDGQSRLVGGWHELTPIASAPRAVQAAVRRAGLDEADVTWFGGIVLRRPAAQAIRDHYEAVLAERQAAHTATHPGAAERAAIDELFGAADYWEHDAPDTDPARAARLRAEARNGLEVWRAKYPREAAEETAARLRAAAEKKRELAAKALVFDADGLYDAGARQSRHDRFAAEAAELERQAAELAAD